MSPSLCNSSYRYVISSIIGLFDTISLRYHNHIVATYTNKSRVHPCFLQPYRFYGPIEVHAPTIIEREHIFYDKLTEIIVANDNFMCTNERLRSFARELSSRSQGYSLADVYDAIYRAQVELDIRTKIKGIWLL